MTTAQADKLIRSGSWVRIVDKYGSTGTVKIIRRERSSLYCENGEVFNRTDIELAGGGHDRT